jgi:hypothetical protein
MAKLLADPALIVGLVRSILILLVSFGVAVTQAQQDSILMFTGAFLAVLSLVLTGVTLKVTTPVANPVLPTGTTVNVTTPKGQADYLKTV